MYRIGQFSLMTKVTVKALRFYEDEGLLYPVYVDPSTGYRFYDTSQLPTVHKIVSLKQCGFSIPEIKQILRGGNMEPFFESQISQLKDDLTNIQSKLSSIQSYVDSLEKEKTLPYTVVIKELPRVTVFSCRMVVESYDSYFQVIPEIGREIGEANPGLQCKEDPFYSFIVYHDGEYKSQDIDIEYCEAVVKAGKDTERIKFKVVERVPKAACVIHKGPYSTLPKAYCALYKWIEDNKLECADYPRESYIDGIWNRENPEDWITEIQVPLK